MKSPFRSSHLAFAFAVALCAVPVRADTPVSFWHAIVPEKAVQCFELDMNDITFRHSREARLNLEDDAAQVKLEARAPEERHALESKFVAVTTPKPRLVQRLPVPALTGIHTAQASALVVVGPDGKVADVFVADATNDTFARAVALAAKSWRFEKSSEAHLIAVPCSMRAAP